MPVMGGSRFGMGAVIHQLLASAAPEDAVFGCARQYREWLRARGIRSDIYAEGIDPALAAGEVLPHRRLSREEGMADALVFHYATGADVTAFARQSKIPLVLAYHNITPSAYFRSVHRRLYTSTAQGREDLPSLAHATLSLAFSEYSRKELEGVGFRNVHVLPLALDEDRYAVPPDEGIVERFSDGWVNLLFVGRIAPNKKHEDLIRAFHYYRRINPNSRLLLVGSWRMCESYKVWLEQYCQWLGLSDVHFCGHVSRAQLVAYYRVGNVFVCMSEHEGFCVPLVEAMHFGVPIIAYGATAVPDTLGTAGVLLKEKDYPTIAEMVNLMVTDAAVRGRVVAHQRERLEAFRPGIVQDRLLALLSEHVLGER